MPSDWIYRHYLVINTSEHALAQDIATGVTNNPDDIYSFNIEISADAEYPATHLGANTMSTQDMLTGMQARMGELTTLSYARVDPDTYVVQASNVTSTGQACGFIEMLDAIGLTEVTGELP